jgi:nucleotide-binding universal stress UspA family protein
LFSSIHAPAGTSSEKKTEKGREIMTRRILLATDGSRNATGAAHYLANLYKGALDVEVTVLNISPAVPPLYREPGHGPAVHRQFMEWKKKREVEAKAYFHETSNVFLDAEFKKNQVKTKYLLQAVGVARDIIREVDSGSFDACVVGKKGMGWFDSIFLGSITGKLLEISENHPLWLVDGKGSKSRRVLIAMDETPRAIELARQAGRMLRGLTAVHILFYHYCSPFTETLSSEERKRMKDSEKEVVERERARMAQIAKEAKEALMAEGMNPRSLNYQFQYDPSARSKKISRAILSKLHEGGYGTLLLGRKGKTGAREFRIGSVTLRIITEVQHCAVWLM